MSSSKLFNATGELNKLDFNNFSKKISKIHVGFSKIVSGWIIEDFFLDLLAFDFVLEWEKREKCLDTIKRERK